MTGFILKIILYPLILAIASYIFPNVDYATMFQPIIVGLILAVVAHLMEILLLKRETTILSDLADFVAATLVVYFVSNLLDGAAVTFAGALLTSIILTLIEIPVHRWLVRTGKTQKSTT